MRTITSRGEIERIRKRNVIIISVFILFLLLLSTAGYSFLSGGSFGSSKQPNNQNVESAGERRLPFGNSVEDTRNTTVDFDASLADYQGKTLYIVSEDDTFISGIYSAIGNYASRVQEACYQACEEDLPEKDCSENLIIYKESEENSVYQLDNCVFIEGDLKAADAFLYRLFGGT